MLSLNITLSANQSRESEQSAVPLEKHSISLAARRRARRFALQALYHWQVSQDPVEQITHKFLLLQEKFKMDVPFFQELFQNIIQKHEGLDAQLSPFLQRKLSEVDQVELAVLRMGAYELSFCSETPCRVILNEAIELAKIFGAVEGHKYVNGVLHQLALQRRPHEF